MASHTFNVTWFLFSNFDPSTVTMPSGVSFSPTIEEIDATLTWLTYDEVRNYWFDSHAYDDGTYDAFVLPGTMTVDDDMVLDDGQTIYLARNVGFYASANPYYGATCSVGFTAFGYQQAGFDFSNGNVADGRVGFQLAGGRSFTLENSASNIGVSENTATWELLRAGGTVATVSTSGSEVVEIGQAYYESMGEYPDGGSPGLSSDCYRSTFKIVPLGVDAGEYGTAMGQVMKASLPFGEVLPTSMRVTVRIGGSEVIAHEYPVDLPVLTVIAAFQDGEQLTDGLWAYGTDTSPKAYGELLHTDKFLNISDAPLVLDGSQSYCASSSEPLTFKWHEFWSDIIPGWEDGPGGVFDPDNAAITEIDPVGDTRSYYLQTGNTYDPYSSFGIGVNVTTSTQSPVMNRNGEGLFPVRVGDHTEVRRVVPGEPFTVIGTIPATQVHLMRHESTYYAGGYDGTNYKLYKSIDEAVTWVASSNFPAGFKVVSWCELDHGGFAALCRKTSADDRRDLYGTVSWDGGTWSTPTLQKRGSDTAASGMVRQASPSGESHLVVSDAQTYQFTVNDFFEKDNPDA